MSNFHGKEKKLWFKKSIFLHNELEVVLFWLVSMVRKRNLDNYYTKSKPFLHKTVLDGLCLTPLSSELPKIKSL